jgi:hypothetical protein
MAVSILEVESVINLNESFDQDQKTEIITFIKGTLEPKTKEEVDQILAKILELKDYPSQVEEYINKLITIKTSYKL